MRIAKATLLRSWIWTTGLALAAFAVLAVVDQKLRALCGVGTSDLPSFASAAQYHAVIWIWTPQAYALRAGFNLGLDYLLIPLYVVSFYFSGIILAEALAPRGRFRRLVLLAAMVPLAGGLCDAAGNTLEFWMLLNGPTDGLAQATAVLGNVKYVALIVGAALLIGAVLALVDQRRKQRAAAISLS